MPPDPARPSRDRDYLFDVVDAMRHILDYTRGMTLTDFGADERTQDAVIRRLIIVGEATKRLSQEFRNRHTGIPWKEMAGMRDMVVHEYDAIDWAIVWSVIDSHIPVLLPKLESILETIT